eukprot:TRINITY_DN8373_c0_g1_i1.p1 TRINITY_DN8373_c0_g1~~TRINITY_DN8373_c0_g1_i1.p1  ORF type:complete len:494 (+),score=72.68 TRINITY_DN8373_c0_g1_i1:122-1603(+)
MFWFSSIATKARSAAATKWFGRIKAGVRYAGLSALLLILLSLQLEAQRAQGHRDEASPALGHVEVEALIPNLHHLWISPNPIFIWKPQISADALLALKMRPGDFISLPQSSADTAILSGFGKDLQKLLSKKTPREEIWSSLCWADSDDDGVTNGEELGDPCCQWRPGQQRAYRVWNLTHPDLRAEKLTAEALKEVGPATCDQAVTEEAKQEQFTRQYYMKHVSDMKTEDANFLWKIPCILIILGLQGYWTLHRGLLRDLLGCGPADTSCAVPDLTRAQRVAIYCAAYLWTDMQAGLTHLSFDFTPRYFPIIGNAAKGFQFHHYHPSAWTVVPIFTMLSHSFLLLGFISALLLFMAPRRSFRAFWTISFGLCLMTVLTHRWVHLQPDENYYWFQFLQWTGLLMSHEHHMAHHQSLVTQFSNLSGITDVLLDFACRHIISPIHYQYWVAIMLLWLAIPIAVGAEGFDATLWRQLLLRESPKVAALGGPDCARDFP